MAEMVAREGGRESANETSPTVIGRFRTGNAQ